MKDVIINGSSYNGVPHVLIPLKDGGGNAKFVDTDSGDAVAGDLRAGKIAWVDGDEITGSLAEKSSSDVTASGKTVTVPAGIYDSQVQKSVADGSVTPSATVSGTVIGDTSSSYSITITPAATVSAGYVSGNASGTAITKYVQTETKNADPSTSAQDITPTSGKLLSSVHVNAVSLTGTATAADVMSGKTFYKDSLTKLTGSASVPTVSQNTTTHVLTIS